MAIFIDSFRNPVLTQSMIIISFFGREVIFVVTIIVVILLLLKKHRREAVLFSLTIFGSALLNTQLKNIIQRPRPTLNPLQIVHDFSFPSGHADSSLVFYITLTYLVFRFTHNKKTTLAMFFLSAVIILLVGVSRIYLGVHYPSDVIAGYIFGFWWCVTMITIDKTLSLTEVLRKQS